MERRKINLNEALKILKIIYELAVKRMIHGYKIHGSYMIRSPFGELLEELADSFNYITLSFIQTTKTCKEAKIIEKGLKDEIKKLQCAYNRNNSGDRKGYKRTFNKKRL